MTFATVADTIRDVGTLAAALMAVAGLAVGGVRFARRIDNTLDDMRNHVIPHFRPATVDEIRSGARVEGDTIPERVAQLEGDLSTQTGALADHLEAEMAESGQIKGRLGRIEKKLGVEPEESSSG